MLQRRLQIGYSRAGRIIDELEQMGCISGFSGSKSRNVLITREEFEERFLQ
jgi:S-DNA-T family DNA segregation ATPase FtsK/SpoIIIE